MTSLLDPDARLVVAHRGGAARAPENTLAAFDRLRTLPVDGVEFDLRLTADGEVVVHHDATLDRTTDGAGRIAELPLAAVRDVDAGARYTADGGRSFPWRGRGVLVPTLDEVLEALPPSLPLVVELKEPRVAVPARAILQRHGALGRTVIGAFATAAHLAFGPGVARCADQPEAIAVLGRLLTARGPAVPLPWEVLSLTPRFHGLPVPVHAMTRWARRAGRVAHVWTVNRADDARALWRSGVTAVLSDDPDLLLPLPRYG